MKSLRRLALVVAVALLTLGQATAPAPITLSPNSGAPGATLDVTVNGPSLPAAATVGFEPAGVLMASALSNTADGHLRFRLQISSRAAAGKYAFVYQPIAATRASNPLRVANAFTVVAPTVAVRSVTPAQVTAGAPPVNVTIGGTGFATGAKVGLGSGVVANVVSVSPSSIVAQVAASAGAATGARSVIVTNADGSSNAKQVPAVQINVLAPRPAPPAVAAVAVRSVSPSQVTAGEAPINVTIAGTGFATGAKVSFQGGGVVANVTSVAPTSIVAQVAAGASAAPGARDVVVTNVDGSSNANQSPSVKLNVLAARRAPPTAPIVAVRSVSPNQVTAGDPPINVTITGTGFASGAKVGLGSGLVANVVSVAPSSIVAQVAASASSTPGPRSVIVTNADGSSNARQLPAVQLTVVARKPPPTTPSVVVRSITPSEIGAGDPPLDVTIAGAGFAAGAKVSFAGSGLSAIVTGVAPSSITAKVSVALAAAPGGRDVIVTNPDGSSNATQLPAVQLTVRPPKPAVSAIVVRSITPNQIAAGDPPLRAQIQAKGFFGAVTVRFGGTGVIAKVLTHSGTTINVEITAVATAAPGPRPVIVTNPDGASNASQTPPVTLTVLPARPTAPPPTAPPPTAPPPTAPPPTAPPPTAPPPTAPPPTAPPPTAPPPTTPPVTTPPVTPPPVTPPPTTTPPPVVPPLEPPVIPPTELLVGPRIDKVTPSKIEPGKKYQLQLEGKNFSIDTKISLGKDVTIVGAPMIKSPTSAVADVLVSPAAAPGVVPANASNPKGSNSGPGGVLIASVRKKPATPKPTLTPTTATPKKYKQPTGKIILDAPCDPDALFSSECEEPVTLNDATTFVWHELNPGIAKFFVFEIVDPEGKTIFSAQTPKKYFRLSPANLASLPRIEEAPKKPAKIPNQAAKAPKSGTAKNDSGNSGGSQVVMTSVSLGTSQVSDLPKGDSAALTTAMANSGASVAQPGIVNAALSGRSTVAGEVYWRVRGMSNKIDEFTGKKTSEMIQSEDSAERAVALPLPPNGFSCDLGTSSNLGTFLPRFTPSIWYLKRPKPCPGDSLNICGGADFAEFPSSAKLDLRRLPFALQQIGDLGSSSTVSFQNVFIDWGDGTEPEPLTVKGVLSSGKQKLGSIKLIRPGTDENSRLRHMYWNADTDAEYVTYKVRIFALSDQDESIPSQVSQVTVVESKPFGSLGEMGFGSQSDFTTTPMSTKSPQQASAASGPSTSTGTAPGAGAIASVSAKMFTIACANVKVWNPWGAGADEPLYLLTADIIFPTDSEAAKEVIKGSKGAKGVSEASLEKPLTAEATPSAASSPAKRGVSAATPGPLAPSASASGPQKSGAAAPSPQIGPSGASYSGPPTPQISDCSSAFKGAVRLTYWGHGKVKLYWYLDGVLLETFELPSELPPVSTADGKAGKKPYLITMTSALPAVLQAAPHRLQVRAEAVKLTFPPVYMQPEASGKPPMPPPKKLGPTQYSYSQVNQTVSLTSQAAPKGKSSAASAAGMKPGTSMAGGTFVDIVLPPVEPGSQVESPSRFYRVFDHKLKGLPCSLRYTTAQTGMFEITDLTTFTKSTSDTFSGSGMLKLYFASTAAESLSLQPVKIKFTNWALAPVESGDEDVLDVKSGNLDQTVTDPPLMAFNFPLKLDKVSLTAERLALNGNVRLNTGQGFTNATVDELPRWEFTTTPLTSEGDFRFAKSKAVQTELGASQFLLKISNAEIDLSRKEGSAPSQTCKPAVTDATWRGIRVDGVLSAPDALAFNNVKLLKDYPFTGWGIGPGGLDVKFEDPAFVKSISTSGVGVKATGFTFSVCNGSFGSPTFGVEVSNAPLVVQTIKGKISLDAFAVPHSSFPGIDVNHNWGNVKAKITDASLGYSALIGNFAISINSHFWFQVRGKPAYDHAYDGILITLEGNVFAPNGKQYFAVPDAGTANIAGYPMQVTQLGVGNKPNGNIWFGFMGDIEVGDNAPNAEDREAQFNLTKTSALLKGSDPIQLASLAALESFATDDQSFDYSSSTEDGVTVNKVHLDFSYPPSSKTVTVVADCLWEERPDGFYFVGTGKVTVADSFGIDIQALYGREVNESYWMVKAAVDLPTMMALGSTGLGLKAIHGGLGCSVPISAYDLPDIKMVKTDHSGGYSFSAAVDIGTMDAFTVYARGRLTVKMSGPDAGARVSVAAWFVTSTHELPAMGEACMQYAGGAFDAGATLHLSLAGGLVVIDAPKSGPDVCTQAAVSIHFGGSTDWHIWIGQETLPLTAKVLVINGKGYLMIDGDGTEMFVGASIDKKWDVSIAGFSAYVKIYGGTELTAAIKYSPFWLKGTYAGWVTIKAGADIVGGCCSVGFGANLGFSAEAPPPKVCGKVGISFSTPWPMSDINVSVGPLCIGG